MATAGLSSLEAVNAMLRTVNEGAVAALGSSGSFPTKAFNTSIAGQAEDVLTEVSRRIQMMGWPENTDLFLSVTPTAVTFLCTLAVTDLWLRASGASGFRNFTIRGVSATSYIWDVDNRTNNFGSVTPITVDKVIWLEFDNLQPRTKEVVLAAAATIFQRRQRGSPDHDAYLKEEQVMADLIASRIDGRLTLPPINPSPLLAQVLAGGQRQQQ